MLKIHFTFDSFNRLERPQLILAEASGKRLGVINDIALEASIRWTSHSEIRFTASSVLNGIEGGQCQLFDEIKELRRIHVPHFGWFRIQGVVEINEGHRLVKECIAYSAEVEFQNKLVTEIEGQFRLVNPIAPHDSLMGVLLLMVPGWSVGHIDGTLLTRWRTLEVTERDLYSLLTQDIADAFECIFIFDYENYTIDILDIARQFKDTSIYISHENLMKLSSTNIITDGIVTALHVRGGNIDIAGVNPNGTDVIYNVDYFKPRMSEGLLAALQLYESTFATLQPLYSDLLVQLRVLTGQLATLINNPPTYELRFDVLGDGTAYVLPNLNNASGLSQFQTLRRALEGVRAARIEHGNIPYTDVNGIISVLEPMINAKNADIDAVRAQIGDVNNQLRAISDQLIIRNFFTDEQWVELNRYFIYDTFQEESMFWTDVMSQQERQDIQQELFDMGVRTLMRASYPAFEININAINFLALSEFQAFTEQFELGTTFTLNMGHYHVKPLLLEVNINFDDPTDFSLVFANKHTLDSGFSLIDFNAGSINAIHTISFDRMRIEAMKAQTDDVTSFLNGTLNATRNNIVNNPYQTRVIIDETGLRTRSYDWNTGLPTGNSIWITGSHIGISRDNFTTAGLAIGLIDAPGAGGGQVFGVVADAIVGRILAGNNLHIANENNNFILDDTGAWLNNANFTLTRTTGGVTNRIVLDPTEGFAIYRNNVRQVFIDSNGNLQLIGNISGGSININNNFIVTNQGNMTANNAVLNHVTMWNAHITGGSMTLGNTVITESWFQTANGWMSNFFNSNFDASNNIHGGAITLNTLHANSIVAGSITADRIGANQITANHIVANAITANHIAANAITANHIAANAITADMISAGTLRGVVVEFGGGTARLEQGTGHDGVSGTLVADINSNAGLRLNAFGGGIALISNGNGVFMVGARVQANGQDVATVADISGLQSQINWLQSDISSLWAMIWGINSCNC